MKKTFLSLLGLISLFSLSGCNSITAVNIDGDPKVVKKELDSSITKFETDCLNVGKDAVITYQYSKDETSINMSYKSGLDEYGIDFQYSLGKLLVKTNSNQQLTNTGLEIVVKGAFKELSLDGNYSFKFDGFGANQMNIVINGNINFTGEDFEAGSKYDITVNGTSKMYAKGETDNLFLTINGKANANFKELVAKSSTISTQGASEVELSVTNTLAYTINGSSHLAYYGSPQITQKVKNGLATVSKKYSKTYPEFLYDEQNS